MSSIALKSTLMKALATQSGFSAMPTSVTTELATKDCGLPISPRRDYRWRGDLQELEAQVMPEPWRPRRLLSLLRSCSICF